MLEKFGAKWGKEVRIIGISIDSNIDAVKNRIKERGWHSVEHYFKGPSTCNENYDFRGIPHVALIDRCGKIIYKGHPASCNLEQKINEALSNTECDLSGEEDAPAESHLHKINKCYSHNAPERCKDWRSQSGKIKYKWTLQNDTEKTLTLDWLDYKGKPTSYG